ncbi:MAG: hypothetical protein DRI46_07845 [Chloroflexi bacterium]|nr:MAG: hypothetical protein DRI46_07845 [Chloroflexota bacterium]
MKRRIPITHTPLQQYAAGLGLNPLHFEGAIVNDLFQGTSSCGTVWHRHTWQSPDSVSHEDLAIQMRDAERAIGDFFGYRIAPEWQVLDMVYPRSQPGLSYMTDRRGRYRTLQLQQGKIIAGGRRGIEYIDTIAVQYKDLDNDGFAETAEIDVGQEVDWTEIKIYHEGTKGDPAWEIRPHREINGSVISMDAWLFIDSALKSKLPTDSLDPITITNGDNLVVNVEVWREYNNKDVPSCTFIWDAEGQTQDGYLEVIDSEAGIVRPLPATYTYAANCATATPAGFCNSREPDRVKVYFYAGNTSDEYRNGYSLSPIDVQISESIRLLTTARLDRDLCGCNNTIALGRDLRKDMALISPQGNFLAVAEAIQECPFGTRRGEWLAWNRLRYEKDKYISVAVI